MSKITTNALTTGAIMAALVVIFALMSLLPVIGAVALLVAGIPLSILCVRHGVRSCILSGLTAGILISLLGGIGSALTAFLRILPLGFVVGVMLRKRQNAMLTFIAAALTAAIGALLTFIINAWLMGLSLNDLADMLFVSFDEIVEIYQSMGLLAAMEAQGMDIEALRGIYEEMVAFLSTVLPVMILFIGCLIGGVHYLLTLTLLKRMGIKMRKFPRFDKWYLPMWSAYGLILALLGLVLQDYLPYSWLNALVTNVLLFYVIVLFIIGLSVIAHWLKIRKQTKGMKVLWVLGVIFVSFSNFSILISLLGAFDILMDFRHIHQNDQLLPKCFTKKAPTPAATEEKPPRKKIKRDK